MIATPNTAEQILVRMCTLNGKEKDRKGEEEKERERERETEREREIETLSAMHMKNNENQSIFEDYIKLISRLHISCKNRTTVVRYANIVEYNS